jgi:hypothetical protein
MLDFLQDKVVKLSKMAESEPFVFFSIDNNLDCDHSKKNNKVSFLLQGIKESVLLEFDTENTGFLVNLLKNTIFSIDKKVICCNIKPFLSFLISKRVDLKIFKCVFYDLAWWIHYYFPEKKNHVKNLNELLTNYKDELSFVVKQKKDSLPMKLYNKVFNKLITDVLPNIETTYLIDLEKEEKVFSFYEVEGQENGRLSCQVHLAKCFNPHSLGKKEKEVLSPQKPFNFFVYLDFQNMEVFVLAEISGDKKLQDVLMDKNGDFYTYVFEEMLEVKNISRNIAKKLFLGIIYGLGYRTLASSLNISEQEAFSLISKLKKLFPSVFSFVEQAENQAKDNGYVVDVFGRKRLLTSQHYKAKNFAVQSPSAFLCLEKLVSLYESLDHQNVKIAYHVHDGYCLMMDKNYFLKCFKNLKNILESPSEFLPSLKLKVSMEIGRNLNNMKKVIFK